MDNIIGLFFDYVYPLTPALHRPSFMADLAARRDKSDPVFFALALVVLASTLVQVPRVLISLDKDEVEQLARRCVRVARAKTAFIWDDSVPMRVEFGESTPFEGKLTEQLLFSICTLILVGRKADVSEGIVHLLLGNNTAHVISTAQANQCALALRLNEESVSFNVVSG